MNTLTLEDRMRLFDQLLDTTGLDHKDYQREGVEWCLNSELRETPPCNVRGGFVADEMGLGKTIMMIGTFHANPLLHTLIVLPPVLIDQWVLQIYRLLQVKPLVYHGKNKKTTTLQQLNDAPIVITSYGAVTLTKPQLKENVVTLLHQVQWNRIVFDEAHHLRNSKTSTSSSAKLLNSDIRWLVSGTPVQNSKKDFYSLCSSLKLPASYYTDTNSLKHLAKNFILMRTKKQVGIIITDLTVHSNSVKWTNEKEMQLSEEIHSELSFSRVSPHKTGKFLGQLPDDKGRVLMLMLKAKQSCIMPSLMKHTLIEDGDDYKEAFEHSSKLDSILKTIVERKDNGCGKLIFCHFRKEIDEIATRLVKQGLKVAKFDGRTPFSKRQEILTQPNDVLILQIQTGCEGLNLQQNYSEIYFVSPHWNPAVEDQAVARCHRIGQLKPVFVHRFEMARFDKDEQLASNQLIDTINTDTITIDSYTSFKQDVKRSLARETLNGSDEP